MQLQRSLCCGPTDAVRGAHRLQAPLTQLREFHSSIQEAGCSRKHRTSDKRCLLCTASQTTAQSATQKPSRVEPDLTGVWIKDTVASDSESYDRACDVMRLGKLQKITAARLIEGLEIWQSPQGLTVHFLTVVPFFKAWGAAQVTERFSFGRETTMQRRDLRGGHQRARLSATVDGLLASISWGEPHMGRMDEAFVCPEKGLLHVTTTVTVDGQTETTRQVYRRSATWKPQNKFALSTFGLTSLRPMDIWAGH